MGLLPMSDIGLMEHNPMATFVLAKVDPVFQAAAEHAGEYLVKLVMHTAPAERASRC